MELETIKGGDSSLIEYISLHSDDRLLVRFKDGKLYEYFDVPRELFEVDLKYATSIGKAFLHLIKGKYEGRRVE